MPTAPDGGQDELTIYVPALSSELRETIWQGSGIVGSNVAGSDRLRLDFEGDEERYPAFTDRVRRAAERHRWADGERSGYPTRACAYVEEEEVVPVGVYDPTDGTVVIDDQRTLEEWLEA